MTPRQPADARVRRADRLGLATFVTLGLPDGMIGAAWPSIRHSLHASVGDLGLVLLAYTAGAVAVSLTVGGAMRRAGVGGLLAASAVLAAGAAVLSAVAPTLGLLAGAGVLFGVAGGMMDGGLNTALVQTGRSHRLNLLHGFYGVGTTIGPLLVTASVAGGSWRPAYAALAGIDLLVGASWAVSSRHDPPSPPPQERPPGRPLSRAAVAGMAVFFVYTGLEVGAGQWEATFGRGHLHLSAAGAGLATSSYWWALTAVRLTLGLLKRPPGHPAIVRGGSALALAGTGLIWWAPSTGVAVAGFVVVGGALAGIFPALVALTPARVGTAAAGRVVPWQIGAAVVGGAGLSAVIGVVLQTSGLAALGPALTALAVLLVAGEVLLRRTHVRFGAIGST